MSGHEDEKTVGVTPSEGSDELGAAGDAVDGYRLVRLLGEGGMGEVWEAEQLGELRRKVALKLIKAGMDTREVIARFEAERQTLARMDHAGIARVYDAGQTKLRRPYFAMEYVDGETLLEYCDRERLDLKRRLELFEQVCAAVQHAHQKGVIHRDLKPGNVLVAIEDGHPRPKIIDFGIATVASSTEDEATALTTMGQVVGTLQYMSPEQIAWNPDRIDTRTDIYSLGVILYELMAGHRPFGSERFTAESFSEVQRLIREEEPPPPSRTLARAEDREQVARARRTDAPALVKALKGDLDWIALRAIEKEPERRYDSAAAFADDIARHLSFEPVAAGPPSRAYRARKFIRRNRLWVAAGVTAGVALVAGATLATVGMVRAQRAEAAATREAETARRVSGFMVDLFDLADPGRTRGESITAKEVLDRGAVSIREELAGEPEIRATLMNVMGRVYGSLGLYDSAEPMIEEALATREELFGNDTAPYADSAFRLGETLFSRGDYAGAAERYREAIEIRTRLLGVEHPDVADVQSRLALARWRQGELEEAESLARTARATVRGSPDPAHWEIEGRALLALGNAHFSNGRHAEAEAAYLEAIEILEPLSGGLDRTMANLNTNTGVVMMLQGRAAEGLPYATAGYESMRQIYGEAHPLVANTLHGLAVTTHEAGRLDDAEEAYLRVLERFHAAVGERHPDVGNLHLSLARLYNELGRYDDAEESILLALDILGEALPPDHWMVRVCRATRGVSLIGQGRLEEARPLLEDNVEAVLEHQARTPHAREVLTGLLELYEATGDGAGAERIRALLVEHGGTGE